MKLNSFLGGCLITLAVVFITALFYCLYDSKQEPESIITTEVVYDTVPIFIDTPVLKDSVIKKYVTVSVPILDTVRTTNNDTLTHDSVNVVLPITQKTYKDSTYEAWVSGYMPTLDSIKIFSPVTTITNTEIVNYKPKRWGLGVQLGVGITPNKIEPYIGIGISYNIFCW